MEYYCLENVLQFLKERDLEEDLAGEILDRAKEMEDDLGLISVDCTGYIFDEDEELQEDFESELATDPDQLDILDNLENN